MNWGNKLIVVFVLFAVLMCVLVYKSVNTRYDLVSKDYYKDELRYQDKIDGMANAAKVSDVVVTQNDSEVIVDFPKELIGAKANGEAWFYCATDDLKDKKIPLQADANGRQLFPKSQLSKANYLLKLSWKIDSNFYFSEKKITIK
jgi:hypothetical protein